MKIGMLAGAALCLMLTGNRALLVASPAPAQTVSYAKYKGAWFTIEYPAGWKAAPSLKESAESPDLTVSAFFRSPDNAVEFYVFSPEWNGNPKDIMLNTQRESLIYHHTERASRGKMKDGSYISNPVANWYTARAKDNSYERSWVDVEDKGLNVRHVFGIKYRDALAYQKYQAQYAHFCKSLEQFSD